MSAAGGPSSTFFVRVYIETDLPTDRRTKKNQTVRESELSRQRLQRPRRWEEKGFAQKTNFRNKSAILMVCVAGGGEKAVKETKDLHFRSCCSLSCGFPRNVYDEKQDAETKAREVALFFRKEDRRSLEAQNERLKNGGRDF